MLHEAGAITENIVKMADAQQWWQKGVRVCVCRLSAVPAPMPGYAPSPFYHPLPLFTVWPKCASGICGGFLTQFCR